MYTIFIGIARTYSHVPGTHWRTGEYQRVLAGTASGYRRRVRRRSIAWPTTGLDSWARHVPHSGGMRVRKRRDVTAAAAVAHAINRREERKDHF